MLKVALVAKAGRWLFENVRWMKNQNDGKGWASWTSSSLQSDNLTLSAKTLGKVGKRRTWKHG